MGCDAGTVGAISFTAAFCGRWPSSSAASAAHLAGAPMSLSITVRAMVEPGARPSKSPPWSAPMKAKPRKRTPPSGPGTRSAAGARARSARPRRTSVTSAHDVHDAAPPQKKKNPPAPPLKKKTPPDTPSMLTTMPPLLGGASTTPRQILLECLTPESADAVLAHRKAKRCPLTVRAAQLLAKGFLATADPNAAADMMIERGWQGFKPEWFDNERAANGQGRQSKKGSIVEAGRRLTERLVAERREREMRAGNSGGEGDDAVRLLPPQRGQRS